MELILSFLCLISFISSGNIFQFNINLNKTNSRQMIFVEGLASEIGYQWYIMQRREILG